LLTGQKLPLIAGNDSHGDFNRYRALKTPFLSIYENKSRYFGHARTGVYGKNFRNQGEILGAIEQGKTFITTGPSICISSDGSPEQSLVSHNPVPPDNSGLFIIGISTREFGTITILRVFRGYYQSPSEKMVLHIPYTGSDLYSIVEKISIDRTSGAGYIRAELVCFTLEGEETMAVSSPCYFQAAAKG
jgi:hypothetical protein